MTNNNTPGTANVSPISGVFTVPEPTSLSLLIIGGMGMLSIRRRRDKRGNKDER